MSVYTNGAPNFTTTSIVCQSMNAENQIYLALLGLLRGTVGTQYVHTVSPIKIQNHLFMFHFCTNIGHDTHLL